MKKMTRSKSGWTDFTKKIAAAIIMVFCFTANSFAQTDSIPGTALEFDGIDDYVSGSGIATPFTNITLESWVRHNSLPAGQIQRYMTIGPEVAVLRYDGTSGTNQLHFYIRQSNGALYSIRLNDVLTINEWFHITGTYDGITMKLYMNGSEIGRATPTVGGLYANDGTFLFSNLAGESLNGKLDEMRLWNIARTSQQIRENMHLTLDGTETGLVSYWQLNEGTGFTITDPVNGNTGTMQNMDLSNWVNSTAPVGGGTSYTQVVNSTGGVTFTGTDLLMDFTEKTGTDTIVVSRLNLTPSNNPTDPDDVFDSQYWVVNLFGNGSFSANLTFTLNEDITPDDEYYPAKIRLYKRNSNSDDAWSYVDFASSVDALNDNATFNNINTFSQFIIGREHDVPELSLLSFPPEFSIYGALVFNYYRPDPVLTDINADGLFDLFVGSSEGNVGWMVQESLNSRHFTYITDLFNGIDVGAYSSPTYTDLDGDNLLDLIIGEQDGNLNHFEQNSINSTSFNLITENFSGINVGAYSNPTFTDIDGDGLLDLIIGELYGNLNLYEQDAIHSTSFSLITENFLGIDVGNSSTPAFTDIDDDGLLDLFIGCQAGNLHYYRQNSQYSYNFSLITASLNGWSWTYSNPEFNDIDSNGLIDLFLGSNQVVDIRRFEHIGNISSMHFWTPIQVPQTEVKSYHIIADDLIEDVSIKSPERFKISLSENSGYQQSLILTPVSGSINEIIYVLFEPPYAGSFSGDIVHSNQDAGTRNLTVYGSALGPDNFAGYALDFDGTDDYVETLCDDLSGSEITIEYWFKGTDIQSAVGQQYGDDYIVSGWSATHILSNDGGEGNGIPVGTGAEDGNWHHIAMTWKQNTANGFVSYLDGNIVGSRTSSNSPIPNINANLLFGSLTGTDGFMTGSLDEVRIWNVARDSIQIRENMHLTSGEPGLVSYWQFNEGTGTFVSDAINSFNGTMHNMNDDDWIVSPIPIGGGVSNSQTETAGLVDFSDTGLSMFFNTQTGAEITVTRIDAIPNINPTNVDTLFNSKYWVVNRYGDGTFDANLTFTVDEDLTPYHQNNPVNISLYDRGSFETGDWNRIFIADVVNAATNQATFNNISDFSQFIPGIYHDAEEPYISNSYPADDGSIFISDSLTITFFEKVFEVAGKTLYIYNIEGTIFQSFTLPHPNITGSGTNTITIDHNNLIMQNDYYIVIQSGTFIDLSGNEFAGLSIPTDWNFSTKVGGIVSSNTTLEDPIYVESDIYIQDTKTLTIEAGSTVEFQDFYKIDVDGRLLAVGTESNSIIFTAADTTGFHNHTHTGWNGIEFLDTPATNDSSKIEYCVFEYGKTNDEDDAGALYIRHFDKLGIEHSSFRNNIGVLGGAVKCQYQTGVIIKNCLFDNNFSTGDAGGLYITSSDVDLINNLFVNNNSNYNGGAIWLEDWDISYESNIINNTICDNSSSKGGGIYLDGYPTCFYYNNIIYGNTANLGSQIFNLTFGGSVLEFYYCDIEGGQAGIYPSFSGVYENCIETNPQFYGIGSHPFNLTAISPCINAGTPDTTGLNLSAADITGNPRIISDTIDIGAYEYQIGIVLNLTAFLEGPYNDITGLMLPDLNPDDIPLTQPYNLAPWNYAGTESVASIPDTNIVDWVLIELRDTTDAALATGETMIAQQAAFILNDGSVVGLDGSSILSFNQSIIHSLFVGIWHRNQLGIMSANPVTESGGIYTYNFSTGAGQAYGTDAQKDLGGGIYGMFSADANADKIVNAVDKTIWENQAGEEGYKSADFDLDGQVNNPDKNDKWMPNEGEDCQLPE